MPIGYLLTVGVILVGTLLALVPLRRSGRLGILSWILSAVVNESPFVGIYWVLGATMLAFVQGDMDTAAAWWAFGLTSICLFATPVLVRRSLRAPAVLDAAFDRDLGSSWRAVAGGTAATRRLRWVRIVLAPVPLSRTGVRRLANLSYGPHGRRNRLDLYKKRGQLAGAPMLIHLHGGGFRSGRKSFYARALLHRFARDGWVSISANYRLRPQADFHEFVVDVKRVIAWARDHALEHGADPSCIVLAGSSAGAHLALTAALTANQAEFQPGFEGADTSVSAAIGLYGYYGRIEQGRSSPAEYAHDNAPPVLIVHGEQDTFVSPVGVRQEVDRIRAAGANPVVYAELPGAQHSFDLLYSVRFELVLNSLQEFTAWLRSPARPVDTPVELN